MFSSLDTGHFMWIQPIKCRQVTRLADREQRKKPLLLGNRYWLSAWAGRNKIGSLEEWKRKSPYKMICCTHGLLGGWHFSKFNATHIHPRSKQEQGFPCKTKSHIHTLISMLKRLEHIQRVSVNSTWAKMECKCHCQSHCTKDFSWDVVHRMLHVKFWFCSHKS